MIKRIVRIAVLALALTGVAQAQIDIRVDPSTAALLSALGKNVFDTTNAHQHPEGTSGESAAEASRLLGMFAVLECDIEAAEWYFSHALNENPRNELVPTTLAQAGEYLIKESWRFELKATQLERGLYETGKTFGTQAQLKQTQGLYHAALRCNPTNSFALAGYTRMRGLLSGH